MGGKGRQGLLSCFALNCPTGPLPVTQHKSRRALETSEGVMSQAAVPDASDLMDRSWPSSFSHALSLGTCADASY